MSFEISNAYVQSYTANVLMLAQQKESRLRGAVLTKPNVVGINYYFDRMGATGIVLKQSTHEPTPIISTPHSRRRVSMTTAKWGEAVDNDDTFKTLYDVSNYYTQLAAMAFGRGIDDFIIDGALNPAFSGPDGATSVAWPAGQTVARTAIANISSLDVAADDASHWSPQRLLAVKLKLDQADVDPDEERYACVAPTGIQDMLKHTQVTSADYNTVKALAEGAVDTFMGFKFILSNRLPTFSATAFGPFKRTTYGAIAGTITALDRLGFCWARYGIGHAIQEEVMTRIAEDPGLSFAKRLYMEMVMGATRVEEARVVLVPTAE